MDSVSSVRDSLPEQHRTHCETLRQEIIDFAQAHGIPRDTLAKPEALREAANKLSTPDLQQLATLLERFEHLLVHHELMKEEADLAKAFEYVEKYYHLHETGKPLDGRDSCYLVGVFFPSYGIPEASWHIDSWYGRNSVFLDIQNVHGTSSGMGSRFSVIV